MTEKKAIPQGDPALPPPGDKRREELAKRKDDLQEKAETLANEQEIHNIDPKALEVDRELANLFDPASMSMLTVTDPQPGWVYSWANSQSQSGLQVTMKKAEGWIPVQGNDPECRDKKGSDTLRRVGDVLLMKIPQDRYDLLQRRDELKRERIQRGVAAELEEMGRKHARSGLKVHTPEFSTDETSRHRARGFSDEQFSRDPRRRMVERQAAQHLGEMVKDEIPGVPLPGKEG